MLCNNYLIKGKVVEHKGENEMEEKRVSKLEGIFEQVSGRMNHLEIGISDLRRETNERQISLENRLESRFIALEKEIRANFRWMIGMWITVILMFISTMLTIILKVG